MAKKDNDGAAFGEEMMQAFGVTDPRQGFGTSGFMIGRDSDGNPGIQFGGKFVPFSEFKQSGGGGGASEDDGGNKKPPGIKDIDYPINTRKKSSLADIYKPKVQSTMKEGGLVRGAGKAQRGRGRGKMV